MVNKAIEKADVLIEALKWIRQHRGKITVVKIGGSLMEDTAAMTHLLLDIVFMESVGMKPVLVHGGGAAISQAMQNAGIEPRFVQGRRYTDTDSLEIVKRVLGKEINEELVNRIRLFEGQAASLSVCFDSNVLFGRKLTLTDECGSEVDMGWVGTVTKVNTEPIRQLCESGVVPVIPSVAVMHDGSGQCLNVNADTAATAIAKELHAEKLVYVSEVNGVRTDPDDPNSMIDSITADQAKKMLASGSIAGGMIPKIQACLETLERGVNKIHIINGRLRHALLLEIFTSMGIGTEITNR
ncbi:MAG: acetylglutamate kinase [Planctomycetaceae bacterium]|jgi:acetylglutamate kinase|nr:acetylglutamate kinase [Planctomycetaceae bacterium]